MHVVKYEIKVAVEGCWVGYFDEHGEWHGTNPCPIESINEAMTLRDHYQQARDNLLGIYRSPSPSARLSNPQDHGNVGVVLIWQDGALGTLIRGWNGR